MSCAVLMAPNIGFDMQKSWTGSGSEASVMEALREKIASISQRVFSENIFLISCSFASFLFWFSSG